MVFESSDFCAPGVNHLVAVPGVNPVISVSGVAVTCTLPESRPGQDTRRAGSSGPASGRAPPTPFGHQPVVCLRVGRPGPADEG